MMNIPHQPKFFMRMDTQYDYDTGQELYHVFESGRLNEFNEPYCVYPFLTFDEARRMVEEMNSQAD
ncbi:MAG TPA: hypothetical protein VNM70_09625 [Burkholderiales bacterium]|nr:hypothetical protein [Burkholderiales bacterium]